MLTPIDVSPALACDLLERPYGGGGRAGQEEDRYFLPDAEDWEGDE